MSHALSPLFYLAVPSVSTIACPAITLKGRCAAALYHLSVHPSLFCALPLSAFRHPTPPRRPPETEPPRSFNQRHPPCPKPPCPLVRLSARRTLHFASCPSRRAHLRDPFFFPRRRLRLAPRLASCRLVFATPSRPSPLANISIATALCASAHFVPENCHSLPSLVLRRGVPPRWVSR